MRRWLAALCLPAALAIGTAWAAARSAPLVEVRSGADVSAALRSAPAGAVVRLGPGEHRGPLTLDRRLTVTGAPGALLTAPQSTAAITITADGAALKGIAITGGESGLVVRGAVGVRIDEVVIKGALLHGIEVVDAAATIRAARIYGLTSPFAQGIEVRNSDGRPDTIVRNSTVGGGQEGIVSHVSEVVIEDNQVSATTMRAIAVTEMSDGWVRRNVIDGAQGVGLYCGDMSRCEFSGNDTGVVAPGKGGRSSAGWGLVVHYHASASTTDDVLAGAAGAVATFVSSRITERSPLEPGLGAGAALPWSLTLAIALGALWAARALMARLLPPLGRGPGLPSAARVAVPVLIAGLVVQSFHMLEHVVQAWRVYVDGVPSRGSLVGSVADTEWVHFIYNAAVLALFVAVLRLRRDWRPPGRARAGDATIGAGCALQGYHVIEHTAKVMQHVVTGDKVNPGLVGGEIDLVWFHFGINAAVYVAFAAALWLYLRRPVQRRAAVPSPTAV